MSNDKTIDTLVDDIKELLDSGTSSLDDDRLMALGTAVADCVRGALVRDEDQKVGLRMSSIGTPCNRKLWYSVNEPEQKEGLPPEARLKFLFGHILEELLLFLAEAAGHKVEGRQDTQVIEGIEGHRDAVIDGVLVDVKSASTSSFKKFEGHLTRDEDSFGYIDQIQSYLHAGQDDPIVVDKDRAAFFVIDKTLGNMCLDIHQKNPFPVEKLYQYKKEMVAREEPPARGFDPVSEGKSGNMKLPLNCSYCDFKHRCHPGLRTFLYSGSYGPRPVYLTTVRREPNVPEVT